MVFSNNINKEENITKTIAKGALWLTASAFVVKLFGVIYKIPLSYFLGDEGMGYFNSAYTVFGFFYILCTAGVTKAITVIITEEKQKGNIGGCEKVLRVSMRLFFILGLLFSLILIVFSDTLSSLVGNSGAEMSLLLIAPSILFISLGSVMKGYFAAYSQMIPIAISQVLEAVGKLVFGLAFSFIGLYFNYSIAYVSALSIFGITLGTVTGTFFLYIKYKRKASFGYRSDYKAKNIIKKIFKISIPITLSASVLSVSNVIDLSVIMRGLENNGISMQEASSLYGNYTTLAVPMLNLIVSLITPVAIAALPKLRELHLRGQGKELVLVLNKTVRVIGFLTVPCAIFFYLCPFTILDILFSSVASVKGAITLSLLAPSVVFLPLLTIINTAHEARGNFYSPIISTIIGTLCKLLFSILMVKSLGILAAPIGTGISYFISLCLSFFAFLREYKFKILNLYIPGIFLALVTIVVPYLIIFTFEAFSLFCGVEYFYIILSSFAYLILSFICQLSYKRQKNKQ